MKDLFKEKMKTVVILSVALIIIGGIIGFMGFAAVGFNPQRIYMSKEQYDSIYETVDESYSLTEYNLENIEMDIRSGDVKIIKGKDEAVKINLSMAKFNTEIINDSIVITENQLQNEGYKWYRLFNFSSAPNAQLTLEVPASFQGDVNIKNSYGNLNINDIDGINNLAVEGNSGKITLSNASIKGNVNINSKYGDISLTKSIIEGNAFVEKNSGAFKAKELKCGDLTINSKYGDSSFNNLNIKNLNMVNNSGNVRVDNAEIEQKFLYDSKYGDLKINQVAAPIIRLRSQSGNVKGSIKGIKEEYQITAITKSGNNNLEISHEGSKELEINSKYGNIDIDFLGN